MAVTRDMLLAELRGLLRLTAFEQVVATVRRTQARTDDIRRELGENAAKAGERMAMLRSAVRQLGGVPDVVSPALGRAGAMLQAQMNQVQTLQEALLGDLGLEHQLRERTRYARTLAETLGETSVLPVLDRLETAHTATIEWLEARLAEVATTGVSALRPTPMQATVTAVRRGARTPVKAFAAAAKRVGQRVGRSGALLPEPGGTSLEGAAVVGDAQQAAQAAGQSAREQAGRDSGHDAGAPAAGRQDAGAPEAAKPDTDTPPFAGYEKLTGDSVIRHVAETDDLDELRTTLAFEQANKARKGVLQAVQARIDDLSGSAGS